MAHSTLSAPIGVPDAASLLHVSRATVKRLAADGTLPSSKLPGTTGAYVFDRADVEALAQERVK